MKVRVFHSDIAMRAALVKVASVAALGLIAAPMFASDPAAAAVRTVTVAVPSAGPEGTPLGGTGYTPLIPARILDTRPGFSTTDALDAGGGRIGPGQTLNLKVTGRGGVPTVGVDSVVLNVTSAEQSLPSFLTIFPAGSARPATSNLNPKPGVILPNMIVAKVGANGEISIYNNTGEVHVVADVHGWFPSGSAYSSFVPARIMDTRTDSVLTTSDGLSLGGGVIPAGSSVDLTVAGRGGVPATGADSVVLNVTAVNQTQLSFLTVYPTGSSRPTSSNLNPAPGVIAPNVVISKIGPSGKITIFNNSGTVDVVVDVLGWFSAGPAFTSLQPARLLDTRAGQLTIDGLAAGAGKLARAQTTVLKVAGRAGLPPTGVGAVAINVTAVGQDKPSFLTIYPTGTARPTASVLNPTPSLVSSNMVIAKVGATGEITIFNFDGSLDVVVDIFGWFPSDVVATNDTATVSEDAAATDIGVLANDTDNDGGPLSIASVTQPAHGTVVATGATIGARTSTRYTPDPNFCGPDTYTYTLNGGVTATVTVNVTCVPDLPVVTTSAGAAGYTENGPAVVVDPNVTVTHADPQTIASARIAISTNFASGEDVLTVSAGALPSAYNPGTGVLTVTGVADIDQYQAVLRTVAYANSSDDPTVLPRTISFSITDASAASATATKALTVTAIDDDPTAVADAATVAEDSAAAAVDVLANDSDVDGGPKSIIAITQPANGTVVVTGGGTGLTYAPNPNSCNNPPGTTPDTFTYTLSPGGGIATVSVTVDCIDDAPTAAADAITVLEEAAATPIDVLSNDSNSDGGPISVSSTTQPPNGTVVITGGGTGLTYAPNANFCGPDTFTYTLTPGDSSATVSATVTCVNDAPSFTAGPNQSLPLGPSGVTAANWATAISAGPANESGQAVSFTVATDNNALFTTQPSVSPNGTLTYTTVGTAGSAIVTVSISDNGGTANGGVNTSAPQTFTVRVNTAPTAQAGTHTTLEDQSVSVTLSASDADGDASTFAIDSTPIQGTLGTIGAVSCTGATPNVCAATVSYTPMADLNGSDTFAYTATDGGDSAAPVDISITITPVNDAPSFTVGSDQDVLEDSLTQTVPLFATDLSAGPADESAQTLSLTTTNDANSLFATQPAVSSTGTLTYVSAVNAFGTATVTVTISDNGGTANGGVDTSAGQTFTITVTAVDDAPVAVNDTAAVTEDSGATAIAVLANDTDIDGGPKSISTVSTPTNGTTAITGGGTGLTYAPNPNYCNNPPGTTPDTFTYTLNGGSTATVSVTVTCIDDPPVAVNDSTTVVEDSGANAIVVLGNDTDVDGGPKSISAVSPPANGTTAITGGGTGVTYTPTADYCNNPPGTTPDTFTYTLTPGGSTATVSVTVTCVNDAPVVPPPSLSGVRSAVGNTALVLDNGAGGTPDPVGPQKTVAFDALAGATDVDGPGPLVLIAESVASADGGSAVIAANGDIVYTPAADISCDDHSDTFVYKVSDQATPTPAITSVTASVSISGCVWYIDLAAGAGGVGTSSSPYNSLAPISGAGDVDAAGDTIFVTAASYSGGLTLEATQSLFSTRHGLVVPDGGGGAGTVTLAPATGSTSATIGGGLVLADSNQVQGINLGSSATPALSGTSIGVAIVNTVTPGAINNSSGGAVNLTTSLAGTNISFTSVTSVGGANGIALTGIVGTFASPAGSISDPSGADVVLSGGSSTFTYGGSISDDLGSLVTITGQTGGVKTFNGAITDGNDGDGGGISITSNTGTAVRFTGQLTLSTGAQPAFAATTGGSISATAISSTLTTTTGTALNITNTTIEASGVTFRSISSSGAPSGIVLNTTGTTGGLTVIGNGSAGTGGTIANSTDSGVFANATHNLRLSWMNIQGSGNAIADSGLRMIAVTGTGNLSSSTVTGSYEDNVYIASTSGTLTGFSIGGSGCAITNNGTTVDGNTGVSVLATGTANITVTVDDCTFSGNRTDAIHTDTADSSTMSTTVTNSRFYGGTPNQGNIAIDITAAGASTHNFLVNSNVIGLNGATNAPLLNTGINLFAGTNSIVTGKATNNTVWMGGTGLSGTGVRVAVAGSGAMRARIENNTVGNVGLDYGIQLDVGQSAGSNGSAQVAVANNTVNVLSTALDGIRVRGRNATNTCALVAGNTSVGGLGSHGLSVSQGNTAVFALQTGANASPITDVAAQSAVVAANPATPSVEAFSSATGDFSTVTACALIPAP